MTTSRADAIAFLTAAADREEGLAAKFPTKNVAIGFRHACHTAREAERKRAISLHDPESPLYGRSQWDMVTCRLVPCPKTNPHGLDTEAWLVHAVSSEWLVDRLQLVDPQTGDPTVLDMGIYKDS